MNTASAILLAAMVLATAQPVAAEDAPLSDQIMELWSEAYDNPVPAGGAYEYWDPQSGQHRDEATRPSTDTNRRSLTPNLDRLMGGRSTGAIGSGATPTRPTSLGHDTFFENPPMTSVSKGNYSDRHHNTRRTRDRDRNRTGTKDCGHIGDCSCNHSQPVPEPGTLLLAGVASAAAWGARRRARRQALQAGGISD